MIKSIYIIGSLRNPKIVEIGNYIRDKMGIEAFDSWVAPGPEADDFWRDYTKARGLSYREALKDYSATHVYEFDKYHLDRCDAALMVMPAGKSGHLELGYTIGKGKPGFVLLEEKPPERYDVMLQFATEIFDNLDQFKDYMQDKIK